MLPQRRPFAGWAGTTCVVTGGLGFIGSNLVRALVDGGARVRVVDALVPTLGGRADQLDGVEVDSVLIASIADPQVADVVEGCDVVFNVAGQVSHTASMRDPQQDLSLNTTSHATLLETIRHVQPAARVVYTSTRQVYGRSTMSTVDETHAASPVDVNGVAKLAGEQLHLVYCHAYGLATTALRLTNVYGPRQRLSSDELGFLPVFVRKALLGEPIEIFGDGTQRARLPARRRCAHRTRRRRRRRVATGHVFNVGHPETHTVAEIAEAVTDCRRQHGRRATRRLARRSGAHRHRLVPYRQRPHRRRPRLAGDGRPARRAVRHGRLLPGAPVVPVVDVSRRGARFAGAFAEVAERIARRGSYLLGRRARVVRAIELAAWTGAEHAAGVASGASALQLALTAAGVGAGDDVLVPAFTAVPDRVCGRSPPARHLWRSTSTPPRPALTPGRDRAAPRRRAPAP